MKNELFIKKINGVCRVALPALIISLLLSLAGTIPSAILSFKNGGEAYHAEAVSAAPSLFEALRFFIGMPLMAVMFGAAIYAVIEIARVLSDLRKSSPFNEKTALRTRNIGIALMLTEVAKLAFCIADGSITDCLGLSFAAGLLIYCFSLIFRYGTQLQQESDETL